MPYALARPIEHNQKKFKRTFFVISAFWIPFEASGESSRECPRVRKGRWALVRGFQAVCRSPWERLRQAPPRERIDSPIRFEMRPPAVSPETVVNATLSRPAQLSTHPRDKSVLEGVEKKVCPEPFGSKAVCKSLINTKV